MNGDVLPICALCLSQNKELRSFRNVPHAQAFALVLLASSISHYNIDFRRLAVCWQCAAMLNRLSRFKHQAEESITILFNFIKERDLFKTEDFLPIAKNPKIVKINLYSHSYIERHLSLSTEVKLENDPSEYKTFNSNNDSDSDVPLKEVKIKKKHKKDRIKKEPKRSNMSEKEIVQKERKNQSLDPNKIKTILLTHEELLQERELDAKNAAYLKLPYKCVNCIQGFDHEKTLKDHIDRKHDLKRGKYQCETCKSVLSSHASFSTHRRRHLLRFVCVPCGKRTIDKAAILKHYGTEHEETTTSYACNECGDVSQSYRALRYHKEKHKTRPQCADCGRAFINKNSLRCHILNQHRATEGKRFECGDCGKSYRGKSGLLMHAWTHRSTPSYCAPCETHFTSPHNYRHHLKTNRNHRVQGDPQFPCEGCDARFHTERKLSEHRDFEHLNSTEFQCAQCSKRFKHRVGLERHRKFVHEKIRPPRNKICHYCGRGFTTSSILLSHMNTHTGARPLSCSSCPATFSHRAALYTHNKLLHSR